jgi:hypothetical protein
VGGSDTGVARDAIVEAVFGAWLTKRHASADRHSFAHAAAVLAVGRRRHPGVVVRVVTNDQGDLAVMPLIAE